MAKTYNIKKKITLENYKNTKEKGDDYEKYILAYLYSEDSNRKIWLWSNIPEDVMCDVGLIGNWNEYRLQRKSNRINKLPDVGCDIFMIDTENHNHLIQCKYYSMNKSVKIEDLAGWNTMLLDYPDMYGDLYYTSKLSENIKARKPTPRIQYFYKPYEPILETEKINMIDVNTVNLVKPVSKPEITLDYILGNHHHQDETLFPTFKLQPRDYQLDAYNALKDKQRTVLQLPCGMGKTLIAIMLSSHYDLVIFISPLKSYCQQNKERFEEQLTGFHTEIVDSEGTRDTDKLKLILAEPGKRKALFVTFKSLDVIMKLWENVKHGYFIIDEMHNIPYDDAIVYDDEDYYDDLEEESNLDDEEELTDNKELNSQDEDLEEDDDTEMESDKTDTETESNLEDESKSPMYQLLHSDARIMFMSATPRLFEESDETAEGMDIDNELFGEVDYQYPMGKAIDDGHICDYMIYVPTMAIKKDEGLDTVIEELQIKDYNKELLVKARFIIRGCMATGSKKCIIYCIEQNECTELMKIIKDLCESYFAIDCWYDTITSNDSRDARKKKLGQFANISEKAFLCSVQILNECIDIPECDSIFITYASKSRIRNIQRLCRANRKDAKNPNKVASVFLWCDEYAEMASFMKHIKEYDSRFSFEKVKRINSSDASSSGIMKIGDCGDDKKVLDGVIVGFKSVASWYENLEKVKKYIDENGRRPTPKSNNKLRMWLQTQLYYSKNIINIMKNKDIYKLWNQFINDDRYKKYFQSNEEDWKNKLEELKEFININNARPTQKTNKELHSWLYNQIHKSIYKINIMKNNEIYNLWNEFINNEIYNKYIYIDYTLDWQITFDEVKKFIDTNNARPHPKTNKKLCTWISSQLVNMKKNIGIMKNRDIYKQWIDCINSPKYKKYFKLTDFRIRHYTEDIIKKWSSKLKEVKTFIDENNKLPRACNQRELNSWIQHQKHYSKKREYIFKNDKIYKLWYEFTNDLKYKKYFNNNEEEWKINFENVKKFINKYDKRPTSKTNEKLCEWVSNQIKNSKKRIGIMRNEEIYNLWNEFINNVKYKKYFDLDNTRDWKNQLEALKLFINTNNANPTKKSNTKLHSWHTTQINNYRNKIKIMKNDEIYTLWTEFITDSRYKKYFE